MAKRAGRVRTGTGDKDNPFETPRDFIRERQRLMTQNELLWKKFGNLQFGPKGVDGMRNIAGSRPRAAQLNIKLQSQNANFIGMVDKWLKNLKS